MGMQRVDNKRMKEKWAWRISVIDDEGKREKVLVVIEGSWAAGWLWVLVIDNEDSLNLLYDFMRRKWA